MYYGIVCSWTWYFGAVAIVPMVCALAAYWALAGAATGWLARFGFRSPWLVAAVWVVADFVVARFPLGGFSWGEVGYALHDVAVARDVASVGGLTLVTYAVVAANALLADLLRPGARVARIRAGSGLALVAVCTVAVVLFRPQPSPAGPLRIAVVQGNDQNRRLTDAEEADRYLPRSHFELAEEIQDPVDLIVFPESSMDEDPRVDPFLSGPLSRLAGEHDAWVLANAVADAPDGRAVNLNVLYRPDGSVEGTYTKRHLVPYGETVPLRSFLEGRIGALSRIPRDFVPGDTPGIFDVAGIDVATVICFESAFGYEIRPLADAGAEAIVVSTNNRSYRRSANAEQHVAIGQMRAAETGRPVVYAAISGISAFIDASGREHGRTDLFERTVLEGAIEATGGTTLYVRFGDWIVGVSLLAIGGCVGVRLVRRRRSSVDSASEAERVTAAASDPAPSSA